MTFNVAAKRIDNPEFAYNLLEEIMTTSYTIHDLIVLNFQEVIPFTTSWGFPNPDCINNKANIYKEYDVNIPQVYNQILKDYDLNVLNTNANTHQHYNHQNDIQEEIVTGSDVFDENDNKKQLPIAKTYILNESHNCGLQQVIIGNKYKYSTQIDQQTKQQSQQGRFSKSQTLKFGVMGLVASKGAIVTKFNQINYDIQFVNVHFEAHDKNQLIRQNQLKKTLKSIHKNNESKKYLIILAGDTNSRILNFKKLKQDSLLKYDDFNLQKAIEEPNNIYKKLGLKLFEGDIKFNQSYKFQPNTEDQNFKRNPAWTDRVLLFQNNVDVIPKHTGLDIDAQFRQYDKINEYDINHEEELHQCQRRFDNINISDHRPIELKIVLPDHI